MPFYRSGSSGRTFEGEIYLDRSLRTSQGGQENNANASMTVTAPDTGIITVYAYYKVGFGRTLLIKKNGVTYTSRGRDQLSDGWNTFTVPVDEGDQISIQVYSGGAGSPTSENFLVAEIITTFSYS